MGVPYMEKAMRKVLASKKSILQNDEMIDGAYTRFHEEGVLRSAWDDIRPSADQEDIEDKLQEDE